MKYKNEVFQDCAIDLDGNQYFGCTFKNVELRYSGGAHPFLDGCQFVDPTIRPLGEAWHVLSFFMYLQKVGLGALVDSTCNAMRGMEPPAKPVEDR